jgi:hypothetical protein
MSASSKPTCRANPGMSAYDPELTFARFFFGSPLLGGGQIV